MSVVVALIGATLLTAMFVEPVTDLVYPRVEEKVLAQFERDIPSDALAAEDGDLSAGGLRRRAEPICSAKRSTRSSASVSPTTPSTA